MEKCIAATLEASCCNMKTMTFTRQAFLVKHFKMLPQCHIIMWKVVKLQCGHYHKVGVKKWWFYVIGWHWALFAFFSKGGSTRFCVFPMKNDKSNWWHNHFSIVSCSFRNRVESAGRTETELLDILRLDNAAEVLAAPGTETCWGLAKYAEDVVLN